MTPNSPSHLIDGYLDGNLSPEEVSALAAQLAGDASLADAFVRAAQFDALLEETLTHRGAEAEFLLETRQPIPRRAPKGWLIATAAAALLAAFGSAWWLSDSGVTPIAQRHVISGRVLVEGVESSDIPDGAKVEVLGDAAATIRLAGGADAELAPASAVVFRGSAAGPIVDLEYGSGKFRVAKLGETLRVATPAGAVLGQGTQFAVEYQATASSGAKPMGPNVLALLTVAVLSGQVEVQNSKQNAKISAGESRAFSPEKKPMFAGRVIGLSSGGKRLTLEGKPPKPGAAAQQREVEITDSTQLIYYGVPGGGDKPTVGYVAVASLDKDSPERATMIEFGDKQSHVAGRVEAVADDARQVTLEVYRKGEKPLRRSIAISDRTRMSYSGVDAAGEKPSVGYQAAVWLDGDSDNAVEIRFTFKQQAAASEPSQPKKPLGENPKTKKPGNDSPQSDNPKSNQDAGNPKSQAPTFEKPNSEEAEKQKPRFKTPPADDKAAKSAKPQDQVSVGVKTVKPSPAVLPRRASRRDPLPVAKAIDEELYRHLAAAKIPTSPVADDSEFLRRATLDITGRIPTFAAASQFLEDTDPLKRRNLIDRLLSSPAADQHFGATWRRLISPRPAGNAKPQVDKVTPWFAEQFNQNRGWNEIVYELLTTEADLARDPRGCFLVANSESFDPRPNLLAAATGRLFLGVQLACAECHHHPFNPWKQDDFWSMAAFFSRVHKRSKSDYSLTEDLAPSAAEATIAIPGGSGQLAGQIVPARFLGGAEPPRDSATPLRVALAAWLTADDNPYFARAMVNRVWAQMFGRGLVEPLDGFQPGHAPLQADILDRLASEFVASGYDLQHLLRVLANTDAYGRTSRPTPENESDAERFSHMAIKTMSSEMLYDSLAMALNGDPTKPAAQTGGKVASDVPHPFANRDEFVNFFQGPTNEALANQYAHGIPQLLRLMNAPAFNTGAPLAERLFYADATTATKIEMLYLAVLARRPDSREVNILAAYIAKHEGTSQAYAGALWILLNTSEFVLNR